MQNNFDIESLQSMLRVRQRERTT